MNTKNYECLGTVHSTTGHGYCIDRGWDAFKIGFDNLICVLTVKISQPRSTSNVCGVLINMYVLLSSWRLLNLAGIDLENGLWVGFNVDYPG
jgi:hypothetical protein